MNIDYISIADPPDFPTRYEADDLPEALGDDFELSVEERTKINRAAQWGRALILAARAGSQQALQDLQRRMHITMWHAETRQQDGVTHVS